MEVIILQIFILSFIFILSVFVMFCTKRGREFLEKLRKNSNIYSQRGAIEEIAEQNRVVIRRLVRIEERMEEVEKTLNELLGIAKRDN